MATPRFEFDPDIAFDIIYSSVGEKWDTSNSPLYYKNLLAYVQDLPNAIYGTTEKLKNSIPEHERPENYDLPPMTFGVLNAQKLNCYAACKNGHYYLAIGGLIPFALSEIAAYFFSHQDFFPDIGEPDRHAPIQLDGVETPPFFQIAENKYYPLVSESYSMAETNIVYKNVFTIRGNTQHFDHRTGLLLTAEEYLGQNFTIFDMIKPECEIRKRHCDYVVTTMCTFFWLHEIVHVTHGHIRLMQDMKSTKSNEPVVMQEFPDHIFVRSEHEGIDNDLLLAMEFDADIEALMITLGFIMEDLDHEEDDMVCDKYKRVEIFTFFLIAVFSAIAKHENRGNKTRYTSHPPIQYRLLNIMKYLFAFSSKDKKLEGAINNAINIVKHLSEYNKYAYLKNVFMYEKSQMDKWMKIDILRDEDDIYNAKFHYGNMRILVMDFLVDNVPIRKGA